MNVLDVANKNKIGMPRVKYYILNTIFHSRKIISHGVQI